MNILLLLSALLSALSGLGSASRGAEQQSAVVCPLAATAKLPASRVTSARNTPAVAFDPAEVARVSAAIGWRLAATVAPWTLRRRE